MQMLVDFAVNLVNSMHYNFCFEVFRSMIWEKLRNQICVLILINHASGNVLTLYILVSASLEIDFLCTLHGDTKLKVILESCTVCYHINNS